MKAIIIDDEEGARNVLHTLLTDYCPSVEVVAQCEDVPSGVLAINANQPDVVFLDIEMPNYNGFELLNFFQEINFEIVFVTAYSEYALKAFEVSAVDYLLKPLQIDKLEKAVEKLEQQLLYSQTSEKLEVLRSNLNSDTFDKIALPTAEGYEFTYTNGILYLEADGSYTNIHLKNGKSILISKRIKFFEELLIPRGMFYRVHRSSIVNVNFITNYSKSEGYVHLENNKVIKIAREKKSEFEKFINSIKV